MPTNMFLGKKLNPETGRFEYYISDNPEKIEQTGKSIPLHPDITTKTLEDLLVILNNKKIRVEIVQCSEANVAKGCGVIDTIDYQVLSGEVNIEFFREGLCFNRYILTPKTDYAIVYEQVWNVRTQTGSKLLPARSTLYFLEKVGKEEKNAVK